MRLPAEVVLRVVAQQQRVEDHPGCVAACEHLLGGQVAVDRECSAADASTGVSLVQRGVVPDRNDG